jgi:hypothetical protein
MISNDDNPNPNKRPLTFVLCILDGNCRKKLESDIIFPTKYAF